MLHGHAAGGVCRIAAMVQLDLERLNVAIQGLGRSHRTNQASAPLFCPALNLGQKAQEGGVRHLAISGRRAS